MLGKQNAIKDYRGKILLIDLFSSWCGLCRQQIPALKKIYNKYKNLGLKIIGISVDSDKMAGLKPLKMINKHGCSIAN